MAQTTIVTALFNGTDYVIPHSQHIYDATWVDKLYNGCKRNSTIPFEMVCLVDRQYDIQAPVRQVLFQSQSLIFQVSMLTTRHVTHALVSVCK